MVLSLSRENCQLLVVRTSLLAILMLRLLLPNITHSHTTYNYLTLTIFLSCLGQVRGYNDIILYMIN